MKKKYLFLGIIILFLSITLAAARFQSCKNLLSDGDVVGGPHYTHAIGEITAIQPEKKLITVSADKNYFTKDIDTVDLDISSAKYRSDTPYEIGTNIKYYYFNTSDYSEPLHVSEFSIP